MPEEQIIPWEADETLGKLYVPSYIEELAQEVIEHYDMSVSNMKVISTKAEKGGLIWKIDTNHGPRSLKILHRRPRRSLFSLGAQDYLVHEKNARVPAIIRTNTGENHVEKGGKLWFVAEWIEPLSPVTKDLEGVKELSRALGEFHYFSKGYLPPKGAEKPSRLHRWPRSYEKIIKKMGWFKNIASAYDEMPASMTILSMIDEFEEQAQQALQRLNSSAYSNLIKRNAHEWGLVHQDYGWGNGQMGPDGMWIIDLDGVAYDLPIRDLRKLITNTLEEIGTWDLTWIIGMIEAYHEKNPIEPELYEILLIDMSLPNEFYRNVKEMVYEPTLFLDQELEALCNRIYETEQSKWVALEELQHWKGVDLT